MRSRLSLAVAWLLFLFTFPAGIAIGCILAHGQDGAGRGIAIALGILGGLIGGILAAIFVSYLTIRRIPDAPGKLLSSIPWIILTITYWEIWTRDGDRFFEWLERISG